MFSCNDPSVAKTQTLAIVPWRKKLGVAHRLGPGLPEEGLEVTARQQLQDDEPADKWIDGSTRLPVSGPSGFAQLFAVTFCWSTMERLLRHIYICNCICTPTVLLSVIHLWWRAYTIGLGQRSFQAAALGHSFVFVGLYTIEMGHESVLSVLPWDRPMLWFCPYKGDWTKHLFCRCRALHGDRAYGLQQLYHEAKVQTAFVNGTAWGGARILVYWHLKVLSSEN
jgi:hypothetical protein